jgi:serine/threonine protein kinase
MAFYLAVLLALLFAGRLDEGRAHALTLFGARSSMAAFTSFGFGLSYGFVLLVSVLCLPILYLPGPQKSERLAVAVPVSFLPVLGTHELLVSLGVFKSVPVGGYFASLAGIVGAFVLADRFRALVDGPSIGGYRVERLLGGGGMADVFLAHATGTGPLAKVVRRVALKRLRPDYARDPSFTQMFMHEARIVARLSHPHIVALHDVGQDDGELYLAMELVEGPTLSRVLKVARQKQRLVLPEAAIEVAVQLADALAYAHQQKNADGSDLELIHRDVSPQNVLLTREGHVKLTDFGIARSADRQAHTATGIIKGKLAYMAPEQIRGSEYDQRVDLYALGVLLFEMLTGARPFEGDSDEQVLYHILEGRLQHEDRLLYAPRPLAELVRRLLAPDAAARPATAAELHRALLGLRDEATGRAQLSELVALTLAIDEQRQLDEAVTRVETQRPTLN